MAQTTEKKASKAPTVLVIALCVALVATFLANCTGGAYTETTYTDESPTVNITVNGIQTTMKLAENDTTTALLELTPLTLTLSDLNGNEKFAYFDGSLPTDASIPKSLETGDVMLFGSNCLSIFYDDFSTSYSYTPIGHIDDEAAIEALSGTDAVEITIG